MQDIHNPAFIWFYFYIKLHLNQKHLTGSHCCPFLSFFFSPLQPVEVPTMLSELRQQRMLMVQTISQYKFVHQVLIQFLKNSRLIWTRAPIGWSGVLKVSMRTVQQTQYTGSWREGRTEIRVFCVALHLYVNSNPKLTSREERIWWACIETDSHFS